MEFYCLKARILEPEKTCIARQRLGSHFSAVMNMQAATEELLEAVFSMYSVPTILSSFIPWELSSISVWACRTGQVSEWVPPWVTPWEGEWPVAVRLLPLVEEETQYQNAWKSWKEKNIVVDLHRTRNLDWPCCRSPAAIFPTYRPTS
jgi:hypothetical protein